MNPPLYVANMITRIEAKNYRSFSYVAQDVKPFQVLIGPNASGKSTFLDIPVFIGDIVKNGVEKAYRKRSENFVDLTHNRAGGPIELAVEFELRIDIGSTFNLRYELKLVEVNNEVQIYGEFLKWNEDSRKEFYKVPGEVFFVSKSDIIRDIISRVSSHASVFPNDDDVGKIFMVKLATHMSILGLGVFDEKGFEIQKITKDFWNGDIYYIQLLIESLRKPSMPAQGNAFTSSGSNVPWLIERLQKENLALAKDWLAHIRTAFPDIKKINVKKIPDTNSRYVSIQYANGTSVPSWMVSDGTLFFIALTLIAYQIDSTGLYMIEEPENGLHPGLLALLVQSLKSVYSGQVLITTHSPDFLDLVNKEDLILFHQGKNRSASTTSGADNAYLKGADGRVSLATAFSSGMLTD